ncbi:MULTISPECIES: amino acid permease [Subtercola]|uniref:Amino acid permease n=1 Tax=Subtercola vilae TaxID=2056433 RepID=A0A4T2C271_9MICO|nr:MULTISPECIES: amino acid permease [Subtercola]MEA9986207.1 amino acid permease [Subtercola sp. RTI3]TIH38325.1 amino acid permease [Subtercola vilae]
MTQLDDREKDTPDPTHVPRDFSHEQQGFQHGLKPRQVQMIAIGGAIGTGLFLGAGGRLAGAGPALAIVFAICGVFAFFILRALGELVLHRPSSGSFVSYAREFYGEKFAYAAGWMYFLNWAMTSIVDVTAVALYVRYWSFFTSAPQWLLALIALAVVLTLNLVSVKVFGEMEFWFALIKVTALVAFLIIGIVFLAGQFPVHVGGQTLAPGLSLLQSNGGIFPNGLLPVVIVVQGVVFAYAGIELVGTASGETQKAKEVIPRAINTVILRIAVFYVGSIVLLSLLLPYTAYSAGQSPFVTFFSSIGSTDVGLIAGSIMNFVVLTAALSSLNAGLYSTGRVLHSMGMNGSAPKFTTRMNKSGVPFGGILLTASITLLGVGLNAIAPSQAFEIVLNVSALGIVAGWATIILSQMRLRTWAKEGKLVRPQFRLPGAPVTAWLTLVFLAGVLVLMAIDYPIGTFTVASLIIVIPLLILGWYLSRGKILAIAQAREGITGPFPVIPARQATDALRDKSAPTPPDEK